MKIEGEFTTADVKVDDIEEECEDQIREMVNHEAFQRPVSVMPDTHWGAGAVIGFTMPVGNRVCPNTIGVDIGCGMHAVNLGPLGFDPTEYVEEIDEKIREKVPVGFQVHQRNDYHMVDDFPWEECQKKWHSFAEATDYRLSKYPAPDYLEDGFFSDLCERVGYDQTRAINSVGTLGGGNHFIELGFDSQENVWAIIHSGSRGIGAEIAQHWQERATKLRSVGAARDYFSSLPDGHINYVKFDPEKVSDEDLLDWIQGGKGEDFVHYERLKVDYADSDPEKIDEIGGDLKGVLQLVNSGERNTDLDFLHGDEAHGYIRDMIFAQTYAIESRRQMGEKVVEAILDVASKHTGPAIDRLCRQPVIDTIDSIHNYIDFEDATIRKGACRAHDGERLVIPFNMKFGTLIAKGKGREDWNNSAPHGAGRAMSRTAAKQKYSEQDMEDQTDGTYLSVKPVDETPKAYKDPELIEEAIGPTAEVIERVKPFLSVKAE